MPELRHLRLFLAVAEERNFTRAAERVHMAQQAVSKAVAQLERELGVELLERTTREVRLTPAGAALVEAGPDALAAVERAFAAAAEVGRGLAGTVRLGATPALGLGVLDAATQALRDAAPDLAVAVLEVRPSDIERGLRERTVDLVLARTATTGPDVESAALRPTPAVLAVPASHPLAGRDAVAIAELDGERLLVWSPPGTPYTDILLARLEAGGAAMAPVESRVTGTQGLADLAEHGAVALVPEGWPARPDVALVALEDDVTLPLLVLWLTGAPPAAVTRLRAALSRESRESR
jgi:DNA-binding transcriptional LysR family regulator